MKSKSSSQYRHLVPLSRMNQVTSSGDVLCIVGIYENTYLHEELTHWKGLWCWEGLGAGGEGDDRGWDGWMASLDETRWTWVSVNSGSWWWTGRPGVLRFMGLQRVGHNWVTDLIWFLYNIIGMLPIHSSTSCFLKTQQNILEMIFYQFTENQFILFRGSAIFHYL